MLQIYAASLARSLFLSTAIIGTATGSILTAPDQAAREPATRIVSEIQRADYEGDRVALKRLYDELSPFLDNKTLASRLRYWRGFAMWRRAINGFNDPVDPKELEQDLQLALDEFKEAIAKEPGYVEAKIGMISCLGYLAYLHLKEPDRMKELIGQIQPLANEAKAEAPDNPRLLWVLGPILWNSPPDRGGGQDKAIETYQKGLELCRKSKASEDRLEPSWGEPELLMNLAYSHLNKAMPDVNAAERDARSSLAIVPYWHYVRDILLPQILAAKAKVK
jgi:hypothetical protein